MQAVKTENPVALAERRRSRRVFKAWKACANGRLPSWAEVQALDLGADWRSCFTVDLSLSDGFAYFIFLGDDIYRLSDLILADRGAPEMSLIDLAASKMDEVALSRAPISASGARRLRDGGRALFRSILLPLSDDGRNVTHVFGVATGKGVKSF